jgi:hypothetical protein
LRARRLCVDVLRVRGMPWHAESEDEKEQRGPP